MKNKSKLKKIKEGNNKPTQKLPQGWFLMSRIETTVEEIRKGLPQDADIEVWSEAGVMEIVIGEKSSIDVEMLDLDMRDEFSNNYIASNGVKSLFYLSFRPDDYDLAKPVLKQLSEAADAFICGDSEDFTPELYK